MNFTEMLSTLNDIAATADKKRLLVWYPQFKKEFPDLAALIDECLALPAQDVLPRLKLSNPGLALMTELMGADWTRSLNQTLHFVHSALKAEQETDA